MACCDDAAKGIGFPSPRLPSLSTQFEVGTITLPLIQVEVLQQAVQMALTPVAVTELWLL
jgi:hypothetical protein